MPLRTEDELNRVAYEIRGAALAVHKALGPGCFESAYTPCLAYEFKKRGLEFRRQVVLALRYEEVFVPEAYVADFIVGGIVVVEVKAVEHLAPVHTRQLQTYLRLSGCPLGLIINFGVLRVLDEVVRQVNNFPTGTQPHA
jgi:GxxExxY protein